MTNARPTTPATGPPAGRISSQANEPGTAQLPSRPSGTPAGMTARGGTTLEALAREQHSHAVWLCREFGALSFEDAEDLVAEALSRLNGELPSQLPAARAYLRTMLRRDAIDELRHRHGRRPSEKSQRPRVVALGDLTDGSEPASAQTADGELAQRATRALTQAAVQRALARLPEQERETVRMRYLDELEPAAICEGLGLSRTQYERRLTDGIRGALEALVAEAPLETCHAVREAIAAAQGRSLNAADAARRDAHLEECLACRAFERRTRGLLSLLPAAPTLGWWAQLRLKGEGWLHRGAEAAGGAPGDATTATAAGGATAGAGAAGGLSASGLLGGATLKAAAVCSSAAVAAVCAVQIPAARDRPSRESRPAASTSIKDAERRPTSTPTPTATMPPAATSTPTATPQPPQRDAAPQGKQPTAKDRARARQRAREAEFGPEGGGTTSPGPASTTATTATTADSGTGGGSGVAGDEPAKATPAPPDDSVSAEFSP